jgi:hypothetical protein
MNDLENAYVWITNLRKKYSANADIWCLRRDWQQIKHQLLDALNDGSYQFSPLTRYEFSDATVSLWSSRDMIALKLITQALQQQMGEHLSKNCYHVKSRGGLKKAVTNTCTALPNYKYAMRSDIKGYYASIQFSMLLPIIESYVSHRVLLILLRNALRRTETTGGIFYDYYEQGIAKGSPLSPLLGCIALLPLDQAFAKIKGIYYARFQDDWIVLTKSKTALRKIIKVTHRVVNELKLQLHPTKNFIGKISRGFNFLGYYMDHQTILPSRETLRRLSERLSEKAARYADPPSNNISRRYKKNPPDRDISEYATDEPAPDDMDFQKILNLVVGGAAKSGQVATMRTHLRSWTLWLRSGLNDLKLFHTSVAAVLPSLAACWAPGLLPGAPIF